MPEGGGYYRVRLPIGELREHGHETSCESALTTATGDGADIVMGHMVGTPNRMDVERVHRWWRGLAKTCRRVYELDDDPFSLESHNYTFGIYNPVASQDSLMHCIQTADLVTVSVEPLADRMSKLNKRVVVCRNRIDESMLQIERPKRDKVVIGWAGSQSHLKDMDEASYGLRRVLDWNPKTVEAHMIGTDFRHLVSRTSPIRFTPWAAVTTDYYKLIDFDIGIAPLRSTRFSEAKSAIKAIEYGALGIPVVASDVRPYRDYVIDGVTGWLVRRPHEWANRLRELVNDSAMREEMGRNAKELAAQNTIQTGWKDWAIAYESIL